MHPPRPVAVLIAACCLWLNIAATPAAAAQAWPDDTFAILCYHDVRDDLRERPDSYTVETAELVRQFGWLRENGYHVVSFGEVLAARRDHRRVPDRAVVLSFDDGFSSFYTRVFPLLEAFHYAALVGLVGAWQDEPGNDVLSGAQIREMQRSGLVEFASHSHDLHVGIPGNPQDNLEPAAVTRRYDAGLHSYEGAGAYRERIRRDLAQSSRDVERLTGVPPRAVIWPYGAHNRSTDQIAAELGMPYGLTLELGWNTPDIPLDRLRRTVVSHDFTIADLERVLGEPPVYAPLRVLQVDLDFVYDADPRQQEANLSQLLDRVQAMGVNTVFLQAYADPAGTGTAAELYFPNRRLPMRADLFNRAAWQLRTRTGVAVYAWLPLLAFDLPAADPAHDRWVTAAGPAARAGVRRLSPFEPLVRQAVQDIYEDLSTYASFQGLLFSDDATLNDFEDAGNAALAVYRDWGLPADIGAMRADASYAHQWSERKIRYLTEFSLELADALRADHDGLLTARNVFAAAVGDTPARQWLGQSLSDALQSYDYVALMAMPYLEGAGAAPQRWLARLAGEVAREHGVAKTVFELQSVDWAHDHRPVAGSTLAEQFLALRRAGARNLGYYPDDFRHDRPALGAVRAALSGKSLPGNDERN